FFSSRRRHTRSDRDWSSDVCSSDLNLQVTRQHSRINALKQELEFKSKQLNDLRNQIEVNASQLKQTNESIAESEELPSNSESVQIGRASCRERVEIADVEESIKKKR